MAKTISSGETSSGLIVEYGTNTPLSVYGTAINTTVNSRGNMTVSSGGNATSTTVNSSGNMTVFNGTAINTTISNGGNMTVKGAAGFADNVTVNSGGKLTVSSGGTATNIKWTPFVGQVSVIDGGYVTLANPSCEGVYYGTGSTQTSSANVMSTAIANNYQMYVMNKGTAINTTVNSSGKMFVYFGGTANNTTVTSGAEVKVYSGGIATSTKVSGGTTTVGSRNGGALRVFAGGTATGTTVTYYGTLAVFSGGTATDTIVYGVSGTSTTGDTTTIKSGGIMNISSGGTASNTTVSRGGIMIVYGSTTLTDTTVNDGGIMVFSGDGARTISGTEISSDGTSAGIMNTGSVYVGYTTDSKGQIGPEWNSVNTLSADSINTKDGAFDVAGSSITLTGINQTPLQLNGKITLWGTATNPMDLTAKITGGTLIAKGRFVVNDSEVSSNTFNVVDNEGGNGPSAELRFTGSNTLNNVTLDNSLTTYSNGGKTTVDAVANGYSLTVTNSSTIKAISFTNNGTITMEDGCSLTVKVTPPKSASSYDNPGILTNNGTIEMDAKSTIEAVSLTNTGTASVIINGSADEFSTYANGNMKKVIDLSSGTTTTQDKKIILDSDSSDTGLYLVYHEKGYWLADVDQTTMYVNSSYAGSYGDAIAGETKKYFGYNAFNTISDAPSAIDKIELYGAVSYAAYFDNIEGLVDGAALSKNLYGGKKYTGSGAVSGATNLTINSTSGSAQLVCGGSLISNGQSITLDGTNLTINGGTFTNYSVMGADKVTSGTLTNGASVLTINGGTFGDSERDPIAVAGGAMFAGANSDGNMATLASATTTITGGSFADNSWLYGGSISTSKANNSVRTAITGSTKITIDASAGHTIALSNIVAGSYGDGTVGGNAELVFTGTGGALTVSGQIWGGCSGDEFSYDMDAFDEAPNLPLALFRKIEGSKVAGSRILSFTGFTGTLEDCTKIGAFSDVKLTGSQVTLDSDTTYNFSEVDNWEFDAGSRLTGDFLNNFTGDTLNLTGTLANGTLFTNTNANGFFGFGDLAAIRLDGVSQQLTDANYDADTMTWAWSDDNHNYSLAVSNGTMQFTIEIA